MPAVNPDREIAVAMAFDENWVPHFATCVASLAASRGPESVRIFVLSDGQSLSSESLSGMKDFVQGLGLEIEVLNVTAEQRSSLPPQLFYPPVTYYRLLLPDLLPDRDRVLYLDADTLVLQSLWPLYSYDLGDALLAAARNPGTRAVELGLRKDEFYLNDGVMVMNLSAMRADATRGRAIAIGNARQEEFVFAEQDALNAIIDGRWVALHPRWNAMSHLWLRPPSDAEYSRMDHEVARASPAIVHFEGFRKVKPWFYGSVHPLRDLYRQYRAQTPWPLEQLEGRSLATVLLRRLPYRWQYRLNRSRVYLASHLRWVQ